MPSTRWRLGAVVLVLAAAAAAWAAGSWQRRSEALRQGEHGLAMFRGEVELTARLVGHEQPLPTLAARCVNCHEISNAAPNAAPLSAAASTRAAVAPRPYAGRLDAPSLTTARSRRGGPASRYDEAALCTLLRTGVDPAHVLLPPTMPRYQVSAQDCRDLWAYLGRRSAAS